MRKNTVFLMSLLLFAANGYSLADSQGGSFSAKPFWDISYDNQEPGFNFFEEINDIENESAPKYTESKTDKILLDFRKRVASDFEVPELIFNQTKFWFRIYTEFDSNKKIIHDSLHPQIIFDVIDTTPILARPARAKWLNVQAADRIVHARVQEIRRKLKRMSRKSKLQMSAEELGWMAQFETIQGNKKRIIERSIESVRVQTGQKNYFQSALYNSGYYLNGIEEILYKKGLPSELGRLPFVESSFAIGATSKVGAAGIWQIMPGVGRKFLIINEQIDERRNPWKATDTAAKLLKENHLILYKRWGLALTAYNHGPGGVKRAIQATGSKDIAQIVRKFRSGSFDFASANFYTCFLAALHAEKYADLLWPDFQRGQSFDMDTLTIKRAIKVSRLMKVADLSKEDLLKYNPELDRSVRYNLNIPKGYKLFVPLEAKQVYHRSLATGPVAKN